jgi:hypothetical protein
MKTALIHHVYYRFCILYEERILIGMEGRFSEQPPLAPGETLSTSGAVRLEANEMRKDLVLSLANSAVEICFPRDNSDIRKHAQLDAAVTALDSAIKAFEEAPRKSVLIAADAVLFALNLLPDAWASAAQDDEKLVQYTAHQLIKHSKEMQTHHANISSFSDEQQSRIETVFKWRVDSNAPYDFAATSNALRDWINFNIDLVQAANRSLH